jgi:uncharacterized membrane protein YqjE
MALDNRSLADVLGDVLRNLQEIVRSEVRLAKTEIADEAARAKSSAVFFVAGAVTALFAALFLLLTIAFALTLIMPIWAAMLILGTTLAVVASVMLAAGARRSKQRRPMLERTVKSLKENVAWAQQPSK